MSISSNDPETRARVKLFALAVSCPGGGNPEECQLFCLRKDLSIRERFEWVKNLSDEDVLRYCIAHDTCSANKASKSA